jgi:hypothetical protein
MAPKKDSMKRSPGSRQMPSKLSESLHRQLNMYALAASAAGVGALALVQPAEAKVIYTPSHIRIGQGVSIQLDLNHDGIADFSVSNGYVHPTTYDGVALLGVTPKIRSNEVWWGGSVWAAALAKSVRVASSGAFTTGSRYMAIVGHDYNRLYGGGPWTGNIHAYLGLKFQIDGQTHYGWARLHVVAQLSGPLRHPLIDATLTGYAYETTPNKGIKTGQTKGPGDISIEKPNANLTTPIPKPASLGLLALGSRGLSIWRREDSILLTTPG